MSKFITHLVRGPDQIRTGVEAFAELCLATRPQDLFKKLNTIFSFLYLPHLLIQQRCPCDLTQAFYSLDLAP